MLSDSRQGAHECELVEGGNCHKYWRRVSPHAAAVRARDCVCGRLCVREREMRVGLAISSEQLLSQRTEVDGQASCKLLFFCKVGFA